MRPVLVVVSVALALACAGCADAYGPYQYAGVTGSYPAYDYPYYGYAGPSYYPSYAPYYAAPFVGLGAGALVFSDHNRRFHDFDHHRFEQNHFSNPGNVQHAGPMSLGAAIREGVRAAPPPAPAPAPAAHAPGLGAAIRQGVLGHP